MFVKVRKLQEGPTICPLFYIHATFSTSELTESESCDFSLSYALPKIAGIKCL